jgi:hypothetical protein
MSKQVIVGYARTSTVEQVAGFEAQIAELEKAGCEKIFREQVSSVDVVAVNGGAISGRHGGVKVGQL